MSTRQSSIELKVHSTPLRVTPVTSYDPFEAKFCASLYWLVFRATEDGELDEIPPQVTSPLERDAEHRITVRPEVVELLTSGEVYGKVCDSIFSNKNPAIGHWAVIQCLSRHGFYVVEEGDIAVTDSTLQQKRPFRKSTHLALMDALMSAYSSKVLTIPQVVQAVRRFASFNASKDLPFDLEDALLLWLNKVCTALNDKEINKQKLHSEHLLRDQDKAKRFRFRRDQLQPKVQTRFPVIDDLLKGVSDGQCLLGVVLCYYGDAIQLEDIKFGISQEEMVHNIEVFRCVCSQYICTTSLSLQVEDFLYSSDAMKPNLIALLAEMFYKCELEENTLTDDKKIRSKSEVTMTGFSDSTITHAFTGSNRSSSAPMLASEIIAALSPAVGRKLKDFAKEKSQQRSASNHDQFALNTQNKENAKKSPQENQININRSIGRNTQNYSMQLDFTDEKDSRQTGNPFSAKPVLAARKHSAPDRVIPKVEPKLNKRAKQKPRTLALEDWEMDAKDIQDIHVTDLQRSQSLTGLDTKILEPRQSFHAWQEETSSSDTNLDLNTMKSHRISLDFRPNKSQAAKPPTKDNHHEERVSQDSLLSCSPKSVDSLSSKSSPASKRKEISVVSQSTTSEQELKEFEEMEAIVLAQRSNESNNKSTELSDEDVLNSSTTSDDMTRFRLEILQRLTADKIKSLEKQQNEESVNNAAGRGESDERIQNRTESYQGDLVAPDDRPEELLSPINESSEPLHSTGSLPETRSSTPSTTPSSPCSPLDVAPFTPEFFMTSPANTLDKKAYKKSAVAKSRKDTSRESHDNLEAKPSETPRFESLVQSKDLTLRHKSVEMLTCGSYSMDQISIDAAKAAGIPVIGTESLEHRTRQGRLSCSASHMITVRSLSVPEPLDPTIHQGSTLVKNVVSQEELLQDDTARHFSPQPSDDVVIFDRETSETYHNANAHVQTTRDKSYQEFFTDAGRGDDPTYHDVDNRHNYYPEQFAAAVSEGDTQRGDQGGDASYIRSSHRDSYMRNAYILTGTESARGSFIGNSFVNQDIRSSFVSYKDTDLRYPTVNNAVMDPSLDPSLYAYGSAEAGPSQESRTVYSEQYGTYIKSGAHNIPQGYHTTPINNQDIDQRYRSSTQERHTISPGQFATFRKGPGPPDVYRQSAPGYHLEVSTNQVTTSHSNSQVTAGLSVGHQANWQYPQAPSNIDQQTLRRPTGEQYPLTAHAQTDSSYKVPNYYPSQPMRAFQQTSPPYVSDNRYHGQTPPQQGYDGSASPRVMQMREDARSQSNLTLQTYRTEMAPNEFPEQEAQCSRASSITSKSDERTETPDRKSQAFTVDLDTGELKEFNSSSESISPRSPGSNILRSRTFRKGPEERVFDYDPTSLPGQQNKNQDKASPQECDSDPAVVLCKDNNDSSIVNRTSWTESAEALKAVLYNGFPTINKDDELAPSPRRRTVSPLTTERTSPGARVTWMTAGRNSFGGQVLINEKGEIGESKTNDIDDDTANPQHLAVLRLHFEEKRRQIEADKRRSQEQWEEERRRLGETAFWYTIGRAQVGDKDAGNARPGHVRVPTYEPLSPGQPTPPIGRSTPLECMSPIQTKSSYQSLTVEGCHSDSVQVAVGHGYHHAPLHRPGHQSPSQSGFQSPGTSQASFQFPSTSVPEHQPVTTDEFDFHGNRHDHASSSYPDEHEYETHKFRLSDYPPLKTQQDESPSKQSPHQNRPMTSPSRKCWEVNPAVPTEGFITPSTEHVALQVEDTQEEEGDDDNQSKKGFSMFFGDYSAKPKEGLTPEQHKKRERFLRSRQKKQEDEKARKEAENEKKRLRELKQKVLEEQKRLEDEQREEQQRRIKRESLGPIIGGDLTYRPGPGSNQQDDHSAFAEFSGPRCYVKPSGKSNRKLITNAIAHVCLSGTVNKENKEKCLQAIAESSGFHFIVLFKDGLKFRGLYMLNPEIEQAFKVFGIGPKVITSKMVDCVYKYSSGGKEFIKIPSKTLSISVDGVAVQKVYWQTSKPNVASKTQSNLKRTPRPQR